MEVQSCLSRKGDVTDASIHAPRQSNFTYVQTVRRSIYETRQPEHPHFPLRWYKWLPQGPASRPRYMRCIPLSLQLLPISFAHGGLGDRRSWILPMSSGWWIDVYTPWCCCWRSLSVPVGWYLLTPSWCQKSSALLLAQIIPPSPIFLSIGPRVPRVHRAPSSWQHLL